MRYGPYTCNSCATMHYGIIISTTCETASWTMSIVDCLHTTHIGHDWDNLTSLLPTYYNILFIVIQKWYKR